MNGFEQDRLGGAEQIERRDIEEIHYLRKDLEGARSYIRELEEKVREATSQLDLIDSDQWVPKARADELEVELRRMLGELEGEKERTRRLRNEVSELFRLCDRLRLAGKETESKLVRMEKELETARDIDVKGIGQSGARVDVQRLPEPR